MKKATARNAVDTTRCAPARSQSLAEGASSGPATPAAPEIRRTDIRLQHSSLFRFYDQDGKRVGGGKISSFKDHVSMEEKVTVAAAKSGLIVRFARRTSEGKHDSVAKTRYGIAPSIGYLDNFRLYGDWAEQKDQLVEAIARQMGTSSHLYPDFEKGRIDFRENSYVTDVENHPHLSIGVDANGNIPENLGKRIHSLLNFADVRCEQRLMWEDFKVVPVSVGQSSEFLNRSRSNSVEGDMDGYGKLVLPLSEADRFGLTSGIKPYVQWRAVDESGYTKGGCYIQFADIPVPELHVPSEDIKPDLSAAAGYGVLFVMARINGNFDAQIRGYNKRDFVSYSFQEILTKLYSLVNLNRDYLHHLLDLVDKTMDHRLADLQKGCRSATLYRWLSMSEESSGSIEAEELYGHDIYQALKASIANGTVEELAKGGVQNIAHDRAGALRFLDDHAVTPGLFGFFRSLAKGYVDSSHNSARKGLKLDENNTLSIADEADEWQAKEGMKTSGINVRGSNRIFVPMAAELDAEVVASYWDKHKARLNDEGITDVSWCDNTATLFHHLEDGSRKEIDWLDSAHVPGFANGIAFTSARYCEPNSIARKTLGGFDFDGDSADFRVHAETIESAMDVVRHPIGVNEVFPVFAEHSDLHIVVNQITKKLGMVPDPFTDIERNESGLVIAFKTDVTPFEEYQGVDLQGAPGTDCLETWLNRKVLASEALNRHGVSLGTITDAIVAQFLTPGQKPLTLCYEAFIDALLKCIVTEDQVETLAKFIEDVKPKNLTNAGYLRYRFGRAVEVTDSSGDNSNEFDLYSLVKKHTIKKIGEAKILMDRELFSGEAKLRERCAVLNSKRTPAQLRAVIKRLAEKAGRFRCANAKQIKDWMVMVDKTAALVSEDSELADLSDQALITMTLWVMSSVMYEKLRGLDNDAVYDKLYNGFLCDRNPFYLIAEKPNCKYAGLKVNQKVNKDLTTIAGAVELFGKFRQS